MIDELDAEQIEALLGKAEVVSPLPSHQDREAWKNILGNPMLSSFLENHRRRIDGYGDGELVQIPASLYLNYMRTGNRSPHDSIMAARRGRLQTLVLAELIEGGGGYLDPIMDHIWAICEESSWVIPAHARTTLPIYSSITYVDLVSAGTALTLGEALWLLGEALDDHDPMIRERVLHELDRRCWEPYLTSTELSWRFPETRERVNNWNAVCNCGVVGSAIMALEDRERLARMIEICLRSLNHYLASFDPDGGSDEGASYWAYGFSNYVWLSYLLELRTGGAISPMGAEEVRRIALFPQRVTLSGNHVANFSDCPPEVRFSPSLMYYIGSRLNMPEVEDFAGHQFEMGALGSARYPARELVWMPQQFPERCWKPEDHVYLSGQQWMVSRLEAGDPGCLMLAVKGGNNGENHNQNDLGTFIVHHGGESQLIDLGRGTYTRDYFGENRYGLLVNSSRGHDVPLVNGVEQSNGREFAARVLGHAHSESGDSLELELSGAYPDGAGLVGLRRVASLHRGGVGSIKIRDTATFREDGNRIQVPLYTLGEPERLARSVRILGQRGTLLINHSPADLGVDIEELDPGDTNFEEPVRRILLELTGGKSMELSLEITPF